MRDRISVKRLEAVLRQWAAPARQAAKDCPVVPLSVALLAIRRLARQRVKHRK